MRSRRLTGFICAFVCAISFATTGFAQEASSRATAGKLVEVKVPAPALKGNLLGDPEEQTVAVYLPPS